LTTPVITSRQNPIIQDLRSRREASGSDCLFLEGPHLLEEALKSGIPIDQLVVVPALMELDIVARAAKVAKRVQQVSAYVMKTLSDVDAPQGVIAFCRKPCWDWSALAARLPAPILILDGIQDPGNLATIVRTAEAAGAAGVVTTPGTAHLFSPKALRGAMGSSLRLPILEHLPAGQIAAKVKTLGYRILGATLPQKSGGDKVYTEVDWAKPQAVVLGQEAKGISADWLSLIDQAIYLPMRPSVESLNVGAAAAVILYESVRQRGGCLPSA
jgi:TrmH family RNA methyltransferase